MEGVLEPHKNLHIGLAELSLHIFLLHTFTQQSFMPLRSTCIGYFGHPFAKLTIRSFITLLFFFVMWYSTMKEQRDFLLHERKALLHTRKNALFLAEYTQGSHARLHYRSAKSSLHMTLLTGCISSPGCTIEHALPIQATRW
jgi:hypothetical protein